LHMQLYNSGLVNIQQGILNVGCGYVQVNQSSGGSGTITGGGSLTGDVSIAIEKDDEYEVGPGPTPPTPVTNFTQTAEGTLVALIGGTTPGLEYGQIVVTGEVHLAGNLQIELINGFLPQLGDTFVIIDNQGDAAVDGSFQGLPEGTIVWVGALGF